MGRLRASLHIFRQIVFSLWDAVNSLTRTCSVGCTSKARRHADSPHPPAYLVPDIQCHMTSMLISYRLLTSSVWQDKKYLNISRQVPWICILYKGIRSCVERRILLTKSILIFKAINLASNYMKLQENNYGKANGLVSKTIASLIRDFQPQRRKA